jgi:hypothetical protein
MTSLSYDDMGDLEYRRGGIKRTVFSNGQKKLGLILADVLASSTPDVVIYYGAGNTGQNIIDIARVTPNVMYFLYDIAGLPNTDLKNVVCDQARVTANSTQDDADMLRGAKYAVISDMSLEDKCDLEREKDLIDSRNALHMKLVRIHSDAVYVSLKTRMFFPTKEKEFGFMVQGQMKHYPFSPATSSEVRVVGNPKSIGVCLYEAHEWENRLFWYNNVVRNDELDRYAINDIVTRFRTQYRVDISSKFTIGRGRKPNGDGLHCDFIKEDGFVVKDRQYQSDARMSLPGVRSNTPVINYGAKPRSSPPVIDYRTKPRWVRPAPVPHRAGAQVRANAHQRGPAPGGWRGKSGELYASRLIARAQGDE